MFQWLSGVATRRPWYIIGATILFLAVAGPLGGPVSKYLHAGGFDDPAAESIKARDSLQRARGINPDQGLTVLVRAGQSVQSAATRSEVARAVTLIRREPLVADILTPYSIHDPAMASRDGRETYLVVEFKVASDADVSDAAKRLNTALSKDPRLLVGGASLANIQVQDTVVQDLGHAELLAFPLLFILLLLVFRGLVAALFPLLMGGITVLGGFLGLRLINGPLPLSVFAINLVTGLGLGLSIDYSLLILSRFREELVRVGPGAEAVHRTVRSAGRTVLFSSLTVTAALCALLVFPQRFLVSMGIGGILVTIIAAAIALIVLPAVLGLLGSRVNSLSPWQSRMENPKQNGAWYRLSHLIMRNAVLVAIITAASLIALGIPFLGIKFTSVDATVLPTSTSSRQVSDIIQTQFPPNHTTPVYIVIQAPARQVSVVRNFAARLRTEPSVATILPPQPVGASTWKISIISRHSALTESSQTLVKDIRALSAPFPFRVGGDTARFIDLKSSLSRHLPIALLIVCLVTLVVLFLVTGSVVLPLKSLVMNVLTLSATFGILVLIFQDGRLQGLLGYTSQGALDVSQPILLFVLAFGLSTDYGVFLLSRIKEARDSGLDNTEAVATGIEHTGRVVTAAALLFCVAIGAFTTSRIVFIKELGLGTALAVIIDATVVRAMLVPSLMKLLGQWNWWAPGPLRRIAEKIQIEERAPAPAPAATAVPFQETEHVASGPSAAHTLATMHDPSAPSAEHTIVMSSQIPDAQQTSVIQLGRFTVHSGPDAGATFAVFPDMTIGRDESASDIVLTDPLVSLTHVRIKQEAGHMVVCDLSSTNGTFVAGVRIDRHVLSDGDLIALGDTLLRYNSKG